MRVVLDTNILVSALISRAGPPGQLLTAVKERRITLVTSAYQLAELRDVLGRDRLRPFIGRDDAEDLLATIDAIATVVTQLSDVQLSPDPKDNPILATAIAGNARLIVSGDKSDMLALKKVSGIEIVSAANAIRSLSRARQ